MRLWVAMLAALSLTAGVADAEPVVDGFTWNSGPGRHNPPLQRDGAEQRRPEITQLELHRDLEDARREVRAPAELKHALQRSNHEGAAAGERVITRWARRQQRDLDAADLRFELDAARLALRPAERSAFRLKRDVLRARQRIEIQREAARVRRRLPGRNHFGGARRR